MNHNKKALLLGLLPLLLSFSAFLIPQQCPVTGTTKSGGLPTERRQETNREKNRTTRPSGEDVDHAVTLDRMLHSGDNPLIFDHNKAAVIEGYILKAKAEGPESCNCYSANPSDHDVHIYISDNPDATTIAECAVIEVTPYSRQLNPEWTAEYINRYMTGKKVRVTGWLLHDWEHTHESYETNAYASRIERRTVWELHPVTNIEVE